MVMEVVIEDVGEGNIQCTNHPYKNSTPGGICAFCLQEKLGKLVSSSYPSTVFPSSSSSPSPSFRSTAAAGGGDGGGSIAKPRLPFVLNHKKKKDEAVVFKRSKSTAIPKGINFLSGNYSEDYSPSRRGFWSFLHLSKQKKSGKSEKDLIFTSSGGEIRSIGEEREDLGVDENVGVGERKVSRSRSVGCGSRSFSGDFFERISTGFGDCTLRRVESQREKMGRNGEERVKCGGIFRGVLVNSYFITSSVEENNVGGKSRSWGWAFASPMRAFGKNSAVKRDANSSSSNKNVSPNLSAIPSLLAVSG